MIKIIPTWAWLSAILVTGLASGGAGYVFGINHEKAGQLDELTDAIEARGKRDDGISKIGADTRTAGAADQVATEGVTHASQESIRTVYRDVLVAGDCRQPAGVLNVLHEAGRRANGAVRAAAGVPDPAVPKR